jgi:hypothetical protein
MGRRCIDGHGGSATIHSNRHALLHNGLMGLSSLPPAIHGSHRELAMAPSVLSAIFMKVLVMLVIPVSSADTIGTWLVCVVVMSDFR